MLGVCACTMWKENTLTHAENEGSICHFEIRRLSYVHNVRSCVLISAFWVFRELVRAKSATLKSVYTVIVVH